MGHYESVGLFMLEADMISAFARVNRGKQEVRTKHFAYKMYLPASKIQCATEWCGSDDAAIVEYCQISLEFLRNAI